MILKARIFVKMIRNKPLWTEPINKTKLPLLKVFNSLTNEKNLFKPLNGNKVEWYSCGPTVYDVSHMGHARTYISIDILRRVMKDYLGFDVHYVMNITDIDDKIIKRARQNYLYEKYLTETHDTTKDVKDVLRRSEEVLSKENDPDKKIMLEAERDGVARLLKLESIEIKRESLKVIKDPLSAWLDEKLGDTVNDNSIFEALPRKFEDLFLQDMRDLNILPPDDLTRVSEYIPQILIFVEKIIAKGFAYESNNSVYFDTEKFDKNEDHYYAKLVPTAYGNESLLQEGEGVLSAVEAGEKRSNNDFALWKASKKGEPSWDSPWGKGRPGWHIECSAMAGDKCGEHLDLHTGGVDLKFPHHDNEIAQSEAYFSCSQWVSYFLHTGHLTIAGCKMSKSLKNFISIREALARHSCRQLRFAFLLSSWKDTLDYSDDLMTAAIQYERMLLDFFFNVRHVLRIQQISDKKMSTELLEALAHSKVKFHEAICDSFDTRECMSVLRELIDEANKHYTTHGASSADKEGLTAVANFVYDMTKMFGAADEGAYFDLVRYDEEHQRQTAESVLHLARLFHGNLVVSADNSNEDLVDGFFNEFKKDLNERTDVDMDETRCDRSFTRTQLDDVLVCLADLRQKVRRRSKENKWVSFLSVCDELRDGGLANVGVRLQDVAKDGEPAIGLYPAWALAEDNKPKTEVIKNIKKEPKLTNDVDPTVMFTMGPYKGKFSLYDDHGLPTHDMAGTELSKKLMGKLKKLQDNQAKKFKALQDL